MQSKSRLKRSPIRKKRPQGDIDLAVWLKRLRDHKPLLVSTMNILRFGYLQKFNHFHDIYGNVTFDIQLVVITNETIPNQKKKK